MKQTSLFDNDKPSTGGLRALGPAISATSRTLSAARRRFNALLEQIGQLRTDRERWQTFMHTHARRVATELAPRAARLREQQIALARLFDRHVTHPALGKRNRETLREQLLELLSELLEQEEAPELVALYDRHAGLSRAEEERFGFELLHAIAADLSVDVGAYEGEASPEAFSAWVDRELGGDQPPPRRARPARMRARDSEAAAALESGTRAVRTVFRRLASALHPDREPDPQEQRRKTALMQELNAAYSSGDLVRVLELQQAVDVDAASALARLEDAELKPYISLLEQQAKRLREEIDALIEPIAAAFPERPTHTLTPVSVQRSLERALAELEHAQRLVQADQQRFSDVHRLREALEDIRRAEAAEERPARPAHRRGRPRGRRRG